VAVVGQVFFLSNYSFSGQDKTGRITRAKEASALPSRKERIFPPVSSRGESHFINCRILIILVVVRFRSGRLFHREKSEKNLHKKQTNQKYQTNSVKNLNLHITTPPFSKPWGQSKKSFFIVLVFQADEDAFLLPHSAEIHRAWLEKES